MRFLIVTITAAAVLTGTALAWPGRPTAAPPRPAQPHGPPPAWAESPTTALWLGYSSYCWRTGCADYIPPAERPDLPRLRVKRGTTVRIHFAFAPTAVTIRSFPSKRLVRLRAARVTTWRPIDAGVAVVEIKAAGGSASYAVRLIWR